MTTQEINSRIDANTAAFQKHFAGLSAGQLNRKGPEGGWSIAQNINHLIAISTSYFPDFEAMVAGKQKLPFMAKIPFLPTVLGNMILKSVLPETPKKIKTFPIWEPTFSDLPGDILSQFVDNQEELKKQFVPLIGFFGKNKMLSSPANRSIVYPFDTAFEILMNHQLRHLEQGRRLL